MTKKDFIALANAIIIHNKHSVQPFSQSQIATLSAFCKDQNINFNHEKFVTYIREGIAK